MAVYEFENRLPNTVLENVRVDIKHSGEEFKTQHMIPAKSIQEGQKGECYVGLMRLEDSEEMFPEETIGSVVKYKVCEYNGETLKVAYDDECSLESF